VPPIPIPLSISTSALPIPPLPPRSGGHGREGPQIAAPRRLCPLPTLCVVSAARALRRTLPWWLPTAIHLVMPRRAPLLATTTTPEICIGQASYTKWVRCLGLMLGQNTMNDLFCVWISICMLCWRQSNESATPETKQMAGECGIPVPFARVIISRAI